jgi:hypothetical protein
MKLATNIQDLTNSKTIENLSKRNYKSNIKQTNTYYIHTYYKSNIKQTSIQHKTNKYYSQINLSFSRKQLKSDRENSTVKDECCEEYTENLLK